MGFGSFCATGYIFSYGIEQCCLDARRYFTEEWALQNCPNPNIAYIQHAQMSSANWDDSLLGFSVSVSNYGDLDGLPTNDGISPSGNDDIAFLWGAPGYFAQNFGQAVFHTLGQLANLIPPTVIRKTPQSSSSSSPLFSSPGTPAQVEDWFGWDVALVRDGVQALALLTSPSIKAHRAGKLHWVDPYNGATQPCAPGGDVLCIEVEQSASFQPLDFHSNDAFGYSLSVDKNAITNDFAVVTGLAFEWDATHAASAYLLDISSFGSTPEQIARMSCPDALSWYGYSSAISGTATQTLRLSRV
jgi:hypothetical protein